MNEIAGEMVFLNTEVFVQKHLAFSGITPGIRCAAMNPPSAPNSLPKLPSITSHLDAFVSNFFQLLYHSFRKRRASHYIFEYYHKELEKRAPNKKARLYYLTLFGTPPSPGSLNGLTDDKYDLIAFNSHMVDWLTSCIKEAAMKPILREALEQYKLLIEKLTGQ